MDTNKLAEFIGSLPGAELIIRAARYQNATNELVSPDFELIENGAQAATDWFLSDSAAAEGFFPFARSNDGGLFAFWKCETSTPIVYLASDGEGTQVIASNTSELLSIVAFGSDNYAIDIANTDEGEGWTGPEYTPESLNAFRNWLCAELEITPTDSPLAVIKRSMAKSLDLMEWVRSWQYRKYKNKAKKKQNEEPTFSDCLFEYVLMIVLSPIWIPMSLLSEMTLQYRIFSYLHGTTESAWQRCAEQWATAGSAYGEHIGPNFNTPFEYSLAEYFGRYHRRSRGFLIGQLRNPDPILAAYAFKCLIRCGQITLHDIPVDVLARGDYISAHKFGCTGERVTISKYIRDYFETDQYSQAQKTK